MNHEELKKENIKELTELNQTLPTTEEFEEYSEKLKALSDPTRLKIIYLLGNGLKCTCAIQEVLQKPQSNISHHLKILKNAGFITSEKEGIWVYHECNPKILKLVDALIKEIK
ncbi:helix-turn-helix transcriptional regulator [Methanosphaera sp. WGK6]|uniref:ArsR/SmtB family transcription factor n=1 Tax=Methanosphaera sp. WGK6 TaxID=1561964 RepID=UPI00086EF666|nr:metalloregulator ArsR/SmtB family transcription factor [Methanosphaera sp. WGK6]OED29551.1 hypothetical protein NL43_07630 [Methanosphaera sp. WGK6]